MRSEQSPIACQKKSCGSWLRSPFPSGSGRTVCAIRAEPLSVVFISGENTHPRLKNRIERRLHLSQLIFFSLSQVFAWKDLIMCFNPHDT